MTKEKRKIANRGTLHNDLHPDINAGWVWVQHFIHHLAPDGTDFMLANLDASFYN